MEQSVREAKEGIDKRNHRSHPKCSKADDESAEHQVVPPADAFSEKCAVVIVALDAFDAISAMSRTF